MDINEVRELIRLLDDAGLSALEVCEGDKKVRLEKAACRPERASTNQKAASSRPDARTPDLSGGVDFNNMKEIKSPMVGVFYRAPAEGMGPFVKIGDRIKKGDVLCIIEAMKLMNEILAEEDGEIVDICAGNGQVVEFGQTIFKIF